MWTSRTRSRPPRRPLSSGCPTGRIGTPAARSTRSAPPRCSDSASTFGDDVTTAARRSTFPSVRSRQDRRPMASWCGSDSTPRIEGEFSTPSERRSTSSGRKSICGRGEWRIPEHQERGPRWARRSNWRGTSSVDFSAGDEHGDPADHGLLVLDLTVLSRGERVPFVSWHRVHREKRRGRHGRP
jgi:hypothetical protein